MFSLENKTVLIIGMGKTGISLIRHIRNTYKNVKIIATDSKPIDKLNILVPWLDKINTLTLGGHKREDFENSDIIFLSPGVDLTKIPFAPSFSKEIINDVELAFRTLGKNIIAITGSNGKSTTTKLVYEMINTIDGKASLCGNYGNPILDEFEDNKNISTFVCELSSFQLENIIEFAPQLTLFLNLSEDHLDRYPNYESYIKAKENIFLNSNPESNIIYNLDDKLVSTLVNKKQGKKYSFSWSENADIFCDGKFIYTKNEKIGSYKFDLTSCKLKGKHHSENIMAAILAALLSNVTPKDIQSVIDNFVGIPHRNEFVREIKGVTFYNDSKATNVGATLKAIESFENNLILILGGKDKGGDLSDLKEPIRERVKTLILIGEAQERFFTELNSLTSTIKCSTFEQAVVKSKEIAIRGDVVLLSPACSSYDMFNNYEERGNLFKTIVKRD